MTTSPPRRRRPADRPDIRNATDIHDLLIAGRLTSDEERDTVRLWRILRTQQPGLRSSIGGGSRTGISDPTPAAALGRDPVLHALHRVEHCVTAMRAASTELAELRRIWLRQGAAAATAEPEQHEPGCQVLEAIGEWEPIYRRTKKPGGAPMRLGRWAYDFFREVGRLPTDDEAERHVQGRRISVPAREIGRLKASSGGR